MLEVGLTVRQYVYVDDSQVSTRVVRYHIHQLMVPTSIRGCFARLACDVTLLSEADIQRLGPVALVIKGWPCHGHSCAGAG